MKKKQERGHPKTYTLPINAWAAEDRPREKLQTQGKQHLSNAELLAILLGSGSTEESALALAKSILSYFNNNLLALGKADLEELLQFKGVGLVKATKIQAALELGKRRQLFQSAKKAKVTSSQDAFCFMELLLADLPHEEFWIICLNRANLVLSREKISSGGVSGTVVDAKIVFKKALQQMASSIILIHNHPSGAPRSINV